MNREQLLHSLGPAAVVTPDTLMMLRHLAAARIRRLRLSIWGQSVGEAGAESSFQCGWDVRSLGPLYVINRLSCTVYAGLPCFSLMSSEIAEHICARQLANTEEQRSNSNIMYCIFIHVELV